MNNLTYDKQEFVLAKRFIFDFACRSNSNGFIELGCGFRMAVEKSLKAKSSVFTLRLYQSGNCLIAMHKYRVSDDGSDRLIEHMHKEPVHSIDEIKTTIITAARTLRDELERRYADIDISKVVRA